MQYVGRKWQGRRSYREGLKPIFPRSDHLSANGRLNRPVSVTLVAILCLAKQCSGNPSKSAPPATSVGPHSHEPTLSSTEQKTDTLPNMSRGAGGRPGSPNMSFIPEHVHTLTKYSECVSYRGQQTAPKPQPLPENQLLLTGLPQHSCVVECLRCCIQGFQKLCREQSVCVKRISEDSDFQAA